MFSLKINLFLKLKYKMAAAYLNPDELVAGTEYSFRRRSNQAVRIVGRFVERIDHAQGNIKNLIFDNVVGEHPQTRVTLSCSNDAECAYFQFKAVNAVAQDGGRRRRRRTHKRRKIHRKRKHTRRH
jgi:hypothetical protein